MRYRGRVRGRRAGLVASLFGVSFAIFSGGLATVLLTLWVAWKFPQLRDYVSQAPPPGQRPLARP